MRGTPGRHGRRTQYVLVAGEVALAVVLLLGAGLMMRSFQEQAALDPGFDPDGIVAARFTLPTASYPPERRLALMTTLDASLRNAAGVLDVAFSSDAPLRGVANVRQRTLTADLLDAGEDPDVYFHYPQWPATALDVLVRTDASTADAASAIRTACTPGIRTSPWQPRTADADTASADGFEPVRLTAARHVRRSGAGSRLYGGVWSAGVHGGAAPAGAGDPDGARRDCRISQTPRTAPDAGPAS